MARALELALSLAYRHCAERNVLSCRTLALSREAGYSVVNSSHDRPPRNLRMAEHHIIRQALDRFSDDLKAPSEGTLPDLIGEKVFIARIDLPYRSFK